MPRSRKKRRGAATKSSANTASAGRPGARPGRRRALFLAAVVALVGVGAWFWYAAGLAEEAFLERAERGREALAKVERPPKQGRGHLEAGQSIRYLSDPPTSGLHDRAWIKPGYYQTRQIREKLVHALEHGLIVIYYDTPGAAALDTLKDWADHYEGPWSGLVVAPKPGLDEAIVLTAWNRLLRLGPFDADAAAAFIDEFRGRGPERPVR